ncbi:MAG: ChbG/HpnK family deacetylase [Victivallales bacterium]|jgi:chitin disaccharide deacetylase|nr:ChbG/HpnK family deacetylase [Victivallales bacterium]MBT7161193.1 ChbG/HpnK family deacetylase [Victivallales bacterium]MBT7304720.1 ChbG/HpnK family deacetylase [Victivallales bacterium]
MPKRAKRWLKKTLLAVTLVIVVALVVVAVVVGWRLTRPPLAVRLGYRETDKLLIVNADDGGMCDSANQAVWQGMQEGMISSCTLMVPCPSFPAAAEFAKAHPNLDFGIHLTHTSEWKTHRWGPVLPAEDVPGLVDPSGCLWHEVQGENGVYSHATPAEATREARAQIRAALAAGVDITHLDSHMGAMQYSPVYFLRYIWLGREFGLPIRIPSPETLEKHGAAKLRTLVRALGLVCPDYLLLGEGKEKGQTAKEYWISQLRQLKPGVTELFTHPALETEEMQSITATWKWRYAEFRAFLDDPDVQAVIKEEGIQIIGYRELRDLQRGE